MNILVGMAVGLVVSIGLYIFWKIQFKKFIPLEDAFVIKLICCTTYIISGLICGGLIGSLNKYALTVGIIIFLLVILVTFLFGIYFKHIATKESKF